MITYFENKSLGDQFISGSKFPPPKTSDNITIYSGTLTQCAWCEKESIFFIIDAKISSRYFCCIECAKDTTEKRQDLINSVNENFRNMSADELLEEQEDEYLDNNPDVHEIYVIMPADDGKEQIYLMSYNEIFGSDNFEDINDTLSDGFIFIHSSGRYRLPHTFQLI